MMIFRLQHVAIFKYRKGVVFDRYITGSSACLINTIRCPVSNSDHCAVQVCVSAIQVIN